MTKLLVLITVTLLSFTLGLLVLVRDPRKWVNRAFALFAISVAGWSASGATNIAGFAAPLFWARWSFLTGSVVVFALVLFLHTYPFTNRLPRSRPFLLLSLAALSLVLISLLTPWIVADALNAPTGRSLTYGSLYPLFAVYVLWCIIYSVYLLLRRFIAARGVERQRLTYLFVALLVPLCLGVTTNLLVPLLTGSSHLSTYGPLFSVLMIGMMAHAIIRHRIMNVRLVLRRSVVLLIAVLVSGAFVSIVIPASDNLPVGARILIVLALALAFQPLKRFLQHGLDRYFYRQEYDYPRIIRQASTRIASILKLDELLGYLSTIVSTALRPDLVAIYIRDTGTPHFSLATAFSPLQNHTSPLPTTLPAVTPLTKYLLDHPSLLTTDDLRHGDSSLRRSDVLNQLVALGAEHVVPMRSEQRLVGFVIVGPKMSADLYFTEDLELLTTLVSQAAIAVSNAQLYNRVVLANEYIENIVTTMDSGVITVDASGRVAICNATAERLIGIPRSELMSFHLNQLPPPLDSQLQATLDDGQPRLQVEGLLSIGRDSLTPIVFSTTALTESSGTILGALVVFSDLSKIKALEAEKRRAERLAAFGAFASGVAHEIKNPLVAIRTFAELLPERFADSDFRDDFASVVVREISRIDDLVARLRGIAASAPKHSGTIDVREPLKDTIALLRAQLEQTRTSLRCDFQDDAPYVTVDENQLKQRFLNLLMNAIEAMGAGGDITVRVSRRASNGNPMVVIEVADSGPGIPDHIRGSVFDPFFTTKPRGTGLGLAICHGITDAHRGTIRAHSMPGQRGTTIVVEFPAITEMHSPLEPVAVTHY